MLEQEGTTQFSMAAPAQLVQVVALQQGTVQGSMRVMTGGTGHDTGCNGVCIGLVAVCALPQMACVAHLRLFGQYRYPVNPVMHVVACRTTHIITLVGTACPVQTDVPGMAVGTDGVLFIHRGSGTLTKPDNGGMAGADVPATRVIAAGAVAAFTLQMREGRIGVTVLPVCSTENNQHLLIIVTRQTGVCALVAVVYCCLDR